jgi:hypothetical protein
LHYGKASDEEQTQREDEQDDSTPRHQATGGRE